MNRNPFKAPIPLEKDECYAFVQWLELNRLIFTHISNENTIKNPKYIAQMRRMGVRQGFPDYAIQVPDGILFIEMKRTKGSVVSDAQKQWCDYLHRPPFSHTRICYGAKEAIEFVSGFMSLKR